jgi:hypothetical protein
MSGPIYCPECGADLSKLDPYQHAISCLHLPATRIEDWEDLAKDKGGEYGQRVLFYVSLLKKKGE